MHFGPWARWSLGADAAAVRRRPRPEDPGTLQLCKSQLADVKSYPFPAAFVEKVPSLQVGQPFYLEAISALASQAEDPDWQYPLLVRQGIPSGCHGTNPPPPGVWPTKEELRGQPDLTDELAPARGSPTTTQQKILRNIKATFEEEKEMGMVDGPYTPTEAAWRRN